MMYIGVITLYLFETPLSSAENNRTECESGVWKRSVKVEYESGDTVELLEYSIVRLTVAFVFDRLQTSLNW